MTIGASLFLIAVGAILRFAVDDAIPGVELATVGLILLIIGLIGLVIGLFINFSGPGRRSTVVERDRYPADRGY
jgi:hypothetical protein